MISQYVVLVLAGALLALYLLLNYYPNKSSDISSTQTEYSEFDENYILPEYTTPLAPNPTYEQSGRLKWCYMNQ